MKRGTAAVSADAANAPVSRTVPQSSSPPAAASPTQRNVSSSKNDSWIAHELMALSSGAPVTPTVCFAPAVALPTIDPLQNIASGEDVMPTRIDWNSSFTPKSLTFFMPAQAKPTPFPRAAVALPAIDELPIAPSSEGVIPALLYGYPAWPRASMQSMPMLSAPHRLGARTYGMTRDAPKSDDATSTFWALDAMDTTTQEQGVAGSVSARTTVDSAATLGVIIPNGPKSDRAMKDQADRTRAGRAKERLTALKASTCNDANVPLVNTKPCLASGRNNTQLVGYDTVKINAFMRDVVALDDTRARSVRVDAFLTSAFNELAVYDLKIIVKEFVLCLFEILDADGDKLRATRVLTSSSTSPTLPPTASTPAPSTMDRQRIDGTRLIAVILVNENNGARGLHLDAFLGRVFDEDSVDDIKARMTEFIVEICGFLGAGRVAQPTSAPPTKTATKFCPSASSVPSAAATEAVALRERLDTDVDEAETPGSAAAALELTTMEKLKSERGIKDRADRMRAGRAKERLAALTATGTADAPLATVPPARDPAPTVPNYRFVYDSEEIKAFTWTMMELETISTRSVRLDAFIAHIFNVNSGGDIKKIVMEFVSCFFESVDAERRTRCPDSVFRSSSSAPPAPKRRFLYDDNQIKELAFEMMSMEKKRDRDIQVHFFLFRMFQFWSLGKVKMAVTMFITHIFEVLDTERQRAPARPAATANQLFQSVLPASGAAPSLCERLDTDKCDAALDVETPKRERPSDVDDTRDDAKRRCVPK